MYTLNIPADVLDMCDNDELMVAAWATEVIEEFAYNRVTFAIHQLERGGNAGRLHLQGFMIASVKKGYSWWTSKIPFLEGAHMESRRGTTQEAIDYCSKLDTKIAGPWTFGTPPAGPGQRTDIAEYHATLTELAKGGDPWSRVTVKLADTFPALHYRMMKSAESMFNSIGALPDDSTFVPRPWQQDIIDFVQAPADDRTIHWVYDVVGNKGKSRLTKHLICQHGAVVLSGKLADMAYLYAKTKAPIVLFDITRAQADYSSAIYTCAEALKNGFLVSGKYDTCMLVFKPPHVICFANTKHDETKWSSDRVNLIDLERDY